MANLGAYQKISRVLPGQPFGNGSDGDLTISSDTTQSLTVQSCSGTATQSTLTIGSAAFTNGDVILIHQSRGTGVGQWEINRVSSGGGSTTLTLQSALQYTYTDSGASQAQVMKIPMYNNVTVNSGQTWSASAWDGNTGGILTFACKSLTVTGTISASAKGFRYGAGVNSGDDYGYQGEGYSTATQDKSTSASGSGGGGGRNACGAGGGSGGGAGGAGATNDGSSGNGSVGSGADLTAIYLSGGGGGACRSVDASNLRGGSGGGINLIFAKSITITGALANAGQIGLEDERGGGGGAGGSTLVICQTGTLGTNKITAPAGGKVVANAGTGAVGIIAVHHSGAITGSSTPAFTDVTDTSLVESMGGSFLLNFI